MRVTENTAAATPSPCCTPVRTEIGIQHDPRCPELLAYLEEISHTRGGR